MLEFTLQDNQVGRSTLRVRGTTDVLIRFQDEGIGSSLTFKALVSAPGISNFNTVADDPESVSFTGELIDARNYLAETEIQLGPPLLAGRSLYLIFDNYDAVQSGASTALYQVALVSALPTRAPIAVGRIGSRGRFV